MIFIIFQNRHKDGEPFEVEDGESRVTLSNEKRTLGFTVLTPEDSGTYECIAENRIAADRKSIELIITSK